MTAVDAHHHLWDPADAGQQWLRLPGFEVLRRHYTVAGLRRASSAGVDGRQVAATVVVQSVARLDETRALLASAAGDPLVAGVVGWVDLTGDVATQLEELRAGPGGECLVGVRHLVQDEPDPRWLLRGDVRRGLREVAAQELPFDLLVRGPQRAAGVDAIRTCPGLRVVLDHAGKPDLRRGPGGRAREDLERWARELVDLSRVEGSVCKVSGLLTEADRDWCPDELRRVWDLLLEIFGADRLVFGSDWPVCLLTTSWQEWADVVSGFAADLTVNERDALFGGTARGVYRLTPADGRTDPPATGRPRPATDAGRRARRGAPTPARTSAGSQRRTS